MAKARYPVEAHVLEGRSVGELAATHGVHRSWIYKLLVRYRDGAMRRLSRASRRPRSCSHETPPEMVKEIVQMRSELDREGHDAGAETIAYHLSLTRAHTAASSSATSAKTRPRISSRVALTSSIGLPFGSGSSQSI